MTEESREQIRFVGRDRSLRHYLRLLRKHQWLITLVFPIVTPTGAVLTILQTPIFQASATIMIEPEAPKIVNIPEVQPVGASSPWDPSYYATQHEVIRSQPVLDRVITQLNLKSRVP